MKKIAFIGGGRIASALIGANLASGRPSESILVSDINTDSPAAALGVRVISDNPAAVEWADIVVIAVKPQNIDAALASFAHKAGGKTFVSVVAGVSAERIRSGLESPTTVIRVMPNTPMLLGKGTIAIAFGDACEETVAEVSEMFSYCGEVFTVDEALLDAVTALSGSGPAYFYRFANVMASWGREQGLENADKMAALTMLGAAEMLLSTGKSAAELIKDVSSPGGTTVAALGAFDQKGLDEVVRSGLDAAMNRSAELGKK